MEIEIIKKPEITVMLFKTPRGFMFSPAALDFNEEQLADYEKTVRNNHTVLYSKRFKSFEDMKDYIKKELGLTEQQYQDRFKAIPDRKPKQLNAPQNNPR